MIYLLYGPDNYRLTQKLSELISKYTAKDPSFLLERFDFLQNGESFFEEKFFQNSLFSSKKLFILENVFSNQAEKKHLLKIVNDLANSCHIVFFVEKREIKNSDPLFLAIKQKGKTQEFAFLSGQKLFLFAKEMFSGFGSRISDQALKIFLEQTKNDMWLLSNEAIKLAAFKKDISENDLHILAMPNIQAEIFKTIDDILSGNKKQALKALHRYFCSKENLFYLLSMMAFQARNLLSVKILQEQSLPGQFEQNSLKSEKLGLHPFVFKKSWQTVQKIPLEKLQNLLKKIFLADLEIKTGLLSPEQSLNFLVFSI